MEHKSVKTHKIKSVEKGSVAEKAGLKVGDVILTINGEEIEDIFDYRYDILSSHLKIGFLRDEEPVEITVEKPEDDDLGLEFDEGLMDDYRSCRNGCLRGFAKRSILKMTISGFRFFREITLRSPIYRNMMLTVS